MLINTMRVVEAIVLRTRALFRSKSFLFFITGWLFAVVLVCYSENQYESQLFSAIARRVIDHPDWGTKIPTDSLLVRCLHVTNLLEQNRQLMFEEHEPDGLKAQFIRPVTVDLTTASGACGSYSIVLARLLRQINIPVRIAQMKVGSGTGGHIVVEAKSNNQWIVLDPLYNLIFKRPDGKFASFSDISNNWSFYRKQVPEGYNPNYAYEKVQYTNWNKIPVLLPAIRDFLYIIYGKKKTDEISLRVFFINKFEVLFWIFFTLFLVSGIFSLRAHMRDWKQGNAEVLKTLFPPETLSQSELWRIRQTLGRPSEASHSREVS